MQGVIHVLKVLDVSKGNDQASTREKEVSMSKHMVISNASNKDKIDQLIEEDLITYCDNVMVMVDQASNHDMIYKMTDFLLEDLRSVDLGDISSFLKQFTDLMGQKNYDGAKTALLLCKNYVGDVEVIYT